MSENKDKSGVSVDALGAGSGVGTLFVLVCDQYIDDPNIKSYLSYLTPFLAAFFTFFWDLAKKWLKGVHLNWMIKRKLVEANKIHEMNKQNGASAEVLARGEQLINSLLMKKFDIIERETSQ